MMKLNTVSLIGRITKDIEIRYSQSNVAVANFTLAVNRKFKNQNGEYEADFIRCIAFKKTAEILAEHVKKGNQVGIEGSIQTGKYNKNGQTVFTTDVIVNSFTFVDNRAKQQNNNYQQQPQKTMQSEGTQVDITGDDLPF